MNLKYRKQLRRRPQKAASGEAWWVGSGAGSLIKTIGTLILVVGGLMTLQLFLSLKHMPDLDLAGSAALLAAVAVVGLVIFVFLGGAGLIPALLASGMSSSRLPAHLRANYLAWSSVPALLCILFSILQASSWGRANWPESLRLSINQTFFASIPLSLLLSCCLALHWTKRTASWRRDWSTGANVLFGFWYIGAVWVYSLGLSLVSLFYLQDPVQTSEWQLYSALALWYVIQIILNAIVTQLGTGKAMARGVIFSVVLVVPVLVVLGNLSGVALNTFRALGIADIPVRLTVTREGCEILNAGAPHGKVCTILPDQKFGIVCPVIFSRVGSPNLIQFAPVDPEGNTWPSANGRQSLPLAREHVLTWLRLSLDRPSITNEKSTKPPSAILSSARAATSNPAEQAWLTQLCGSGSP